MKADDTLENNPNVSRQALQELHELLFGWAMSRCDFNKTEAEDLMQQAYMEVISGRARFDDKSSLKTFMFAVVQNLATSLGRTIANRLRIIRQHSNDLTQSEVQDISHENLEIQAVWQAVAGLPLRQRDITELVFCRDMTIEEASEIMGVSVGTGRVHYDRAKKALAISLADLK